MLKNFEKISVAGYTVNFGQKEKDDKPEQTIWCNQNFMPNIL